MKPKGKANAKTKAVAKPTTDLPATERDYIEKERVCENKDLGKEILEILGEGEAGAKVRVFDTK